LYFSIFRSYEKVSESSGTRHCEPGSVPAICGWGTVARSDFPSFKKSVLPLAPI
jgi:hypothetical protein